MGGHQLQPDDANVHIGVVHQRDNRLAQQLWSRHKLTGDVHRIAGGTECRHHLGQPGLRRCQQFRHGQPHFFGAIGHHHTGPARLGGDAQTASGRHPWLAQRLQHVEHLLFIARTEHTVLAYHRVKHGVFHRHRAGVRGRRPSTGRHASDLGQHQGFAQRLTTLSQAHQRRAIGEPFEIARSDANSRVLDEVGHDLAECEVDFVAGVDEVAQAQAALAHQGGNGGAESPGLADKRDRPRSSRAICVLTECGVHVVKSVDKAETVWPAQHHPCRPRAFSQQRL